MGTLFSALSIARQGLSVAQVQLDVTAHNISNVNKEGFSRQRVELVSRLPVEFPYGNIPQGPGIGTISRARDLFLDLVYRQEIPTLGASNVRAQFFERVEDIFQEPNEGAFSEQLSVFFDALNNFANNVESVPGRVSLLSQAQSLADTFNTISDQFTVLRTNANEEVRNIVRRINGISSQVAALNEIIRRTEGTGRPANDLRDDRDLLLDQLAELANITYRERDNGEVDVFLGGDELIRGDDFRTLQAVANAALDPERNDLVEVRFQDTATLANIRDGELFGALQARDVDIPRFDAELDTLAAALIQELNAIHSQGNGLTNFTGTVTATNGVTNPAAPINLAGLPFPVQLGFFEIEIYDTNGNNISTNQVPVIPGVTSLNDLAAIINGFGNLNATVNAEGQLTLTPLGGVTFAFGSDSANGLVALGLNTFFTGTDARNIGVNQVLVDNPNLVASGASTDPTETGDNSIALQMAALRSQDILNGGTQTLGEYFESTIVKIGVETNANLDTRAVQESFVRDFRRRREEVSGVNLDEEATSLLQFQRAFEAAARIITTADRMFDALLAAGA